MSLSSVPPHHPAATPALRQSGTHPRAPGIAKCSPERAAEREQVNGWFAAWCNDNRISERDLASIIECSAPFARKKITGESPINLIDIRRFPTRHRNSLLVAYLAWCSTLDSISHAG